MQVAAALKSKGSWNWVQEDGLPAGTPNIIVNSFLPQPLTVTWIGNGSGHLVLTDANQGYLLTEHLSSIC
jgi:hypothetical protein